MSDVVAKNKLQITPGELAKKISVDAPKDTRIISITVTDEYDLPIKFIGVGEGIHDLKEFDPKEFAGGIFDE